MYRDDRYKAVQNAVTDVTNQFPWILEKERKEKCLEKEL